MLTALSILAGCQKNDISPTSNPVDEILMDKRPVTDFVKPENFVAGISNPFFPLNTGDTLHYFLTAFEDGEFSYEEIYVTTTTDVKVIVGINCTVVHDVVTEDGMLTEDTYDWYAQDKFGNVWYLGEDTKKYFPDGTFTTAGSFEHGIDGAVGGFIMLNDPESHIGTHYKQEDFPGYAQDMAMIVSSDETVTIGIGTFTGCLKTEEVTPLDPGVFEYKYYAPGIGMIKSEITVGGTENSELTGY